MNNCIFCNIIRGNKPAFRLYEDEGTLAFLDIAPLNPGHTLVITKEHVANIYEITENDMVSIAKTVRKVAQALKKVLNCDGINILNTNGKAAWQEIEHVHFHVLPRFFSDNIMFMADRGELKAEKDFIDKLKEELIH